MSISLCMIVKDEESFLEACLQSVSDYVDDIVVTDTGSADKTKDIAKKNGARVLDFKWAADFSSARNFCAENAKHDRIFVLDADEVIISFDTNRVEDFFRNPGLTGSISCYDIDADSNEVMRSNLTRLYDRRYFRYTGRIHEQLNPLSPGKACKIMEVPIAIEHFGYRKEVMLQRNKLERNRQMLEKELILDPKNPYLLYQLGKTHFSMPQASNKACEYFEMALSYNPNPTLEYVYSLIECYGYALLRSGRYKESLKILDFDRFYRQKPCFRFLSAHIYQNNGMFSKAIESFESCLGSGDDDRPGIGSYLSLYNIAVILEVAGMAKEAKIYYQNCGDYEPALERLKILN